MRARRHLAAALIAGAILVGCDAPPSATTAAATPTSTERPSFAAPGSPAALTPEQILAEIDPLMGQSGMSLGEGANRVISVGLRANAEDLARELLAKYGTAIEVTVGNFPYPPPDAPHRMCAQIPHVVGNHAPLVGILGFDPTVVGGEFFRGKLRLTNAGPVPYQLETSSNFSIFLFRPGELLPIGSPEGGSVGTGYSKLLGPGATVEFDASGGTASCDLALGYVLPRGMYEARALVDFQDSESLDYFWSEPTTIESSFRERDSAVARAEARGLPTSVARRRGPARRHLVAALGVRDHGRGHGCPGGRRRALPGFGHGGADG